MELQLSNPITSPSASARLVIVPGAETRSEQVDLPADAVSVDFAKLLAQALPRENGQTIPKALNAPSMDSKDQNPADKADLPSPTGSILPAIVGADDQKTTQPNPHPSRDTTEPGIEVAGMIASVMSAQQQAGAKTASGTEPIRLPASSTSVQKSASTNASITDPVVHQRTNEAQAPQVGPGFVLPTEHNPTMEATALPNEKPVQATGFNATPTDRIASMLPAVSPASAPAASAAPQHLDIPVPLGSHDWNNQLGHQVVWMSNQRNQTAEIRINPPELGPIELRLTLDNQQSAQNATLHFTSPHAEVREAIENSMPQLRELMADAGITLGNATVSSESFPRQQAPEQGSSAARKLTTLSSGKPGAIEAAPPPIGQGSALLDTFA